jgi:epoxyqueuosine reductase
MTIAIDQQAILDQARRLGADDAGLARTADVLKAPSHQKEPDHGPPPPEGALLVFTLAHPLDQPELDYWQKSGGTVGNRRMMDIAGQLIDWLKAEYGLAARSLSYFPGKGGVFLKDAGVLAGLGVIGANNLFISPEHGPRVRLRAIHLDYEAASTGALDFDPCGDCRAPCLTVCPEGALTEAGFQREPCLKRTDADKAAKVVRPDDDPRGPGEEIHYCRRCEIVCLAGR